MDWDKVAWIILIIIGYSWFHKVFDIIIAKLLEIQDKLEDIQPDQEPLD